MHRILTTSILAFALSAAAPALAKSSQKFESSLSAPVSTPVQVQVVIGEDLAYRADNLPKKLSDRGSTRRLNSGFAGNGFYGERDLNKLAERLQHKMETRLEKQGVAVNADADTVLRLVITDAQPNRPTFTQMSKDPGLSFQSFGNGGATLKGELIAAGGQQLGEVSYAWYENDIENARYGSTWSDAHRAMDRFAKRTAKTFGQ